MVLDVLDEVGMEDAVINEDYSICYGTGTALFTSVLLERILCKYPLIKRDCLLLFYEDVVVCLLGPIRWHELQVVNEIIYDKFLINMWKW